MLVPPLTLSADLYFIFGVFHLVFSVYMYAHVTSCPFPSLTPPLQDHRCSEVRFHVAAHIGHGAHTAPKSTGSAGLINTISMFARKAFVAASLGIVATVGWTIQGLGTAFYFRQACHCSTPSSYLGLDHKIDLGAPQGCRSLGRKGPFQAKLCDPNSSHPHPFPVTGQVGASHTWCKSLLYARLMDTMSYLLFFVMLAVFPYDPCAIFPRIYTTNDQTRMTRSTFVRRYKVSALSGV